MTTISADPEAIRSLAKRVEGVKSELATPTLVAVGSCGSEGVTSALGLFASIVVDELADARKNVDSASDTLTGVAGDFETNEGEILDGIANLLDGVG